jgi:hypothetical protein
VLRVAFAAESLTQSAFRQVCSLGSGVHHGPDTDDAQALPDVGINTRGADSIFRHRDWRIGEITFNVRE